MPERNFFDPPFGGRPPSAEAVRESTVRYIRQDFELNGGKYAPQDYQRIARLLESEPQGR